jgi:hypothetical protein
LKQDGSGLSVSEVAGVRVLLVLTHRRLANREAVTSVASGWHYAPYYPGRTSRWPRAAGVLIDFPQDRRRMREEVAELVEL